MNTKYSAQCLTDDIKCFWLAFKRREVIGRQETDGSPQGKAVGDSFSMEGNSKKITARQLRKKAGPCAGPYISHS